MMLKIIIKKLKYRMNNFPNGKILETDVVIAKNYIRKEELEGLELIVSSFLDLAESRAKRS